MKQTAEAQKKIAIEQEKATRAATAAIEKAVEEKRATAKKAAQEKKAPEFDVKEGWGAAVSQQHVILTSVHAWRPRTHSASQAMSTSKTAMSTLRRLIDSAEVKRLNPLPLKHHVFVALF